MALVFDPSQTQMPAMGQVNVGQGPNYQQPGFMERIAQAWADPNVRQAVMTTGLNFMRSPGYGQNGWDVAANSLGMGMQTLEALRTRDRQRALEAEDRKIKEDQRNKENTRGDRQVAVSEKNADTTSRSTDATIGNLTSDNTRLDKTLDETIRHNKAMEGVYAQNAGSTRIKADTYAAGGGKTAAEIEKVNRMKAYFMKQDPNLSAEDADKKAIDYVASTKGKTPRQQVLDAYKAKAAAWMEMQYDPLAQPTPEQVEQWRQEAIAEVKMADSAGTDITNNSGVIVRPGAKPAAGAPQERDAMTEQKINKWKTAGGTPAQIKQLLINEGLNPAIYGY